MKHHRRFAAILLILSLIAGLVLPASAAESAQAPHWEKIGRRFYWIQEDGTVLKKGGWHVLDGERYFLAYKSGRRWEGWLTTKGKKYYFEPETGILVTGKAQIGKSWYYFQEDGKRPGAMLTGLIIANGKKMYAKSSGKLISGWRNVKGKKYYFDAEREAVAGWQKINGKQYYFDEEQFYLRKGWLKQGEKVYYLRKDGTPIKGWAEIKGNRYFFSSKGTMVTGLKSIQGKRYLFNTDGVLMTGRHAYSVNGKYYRVNEDGTATPLTKKVEIYAARQLDELGWSLPEAFLWATRLDFYNGAPEDVPSGYSSQAEFYAEYGFENKRGHCYVLASVFYEMASMLGYRVRFIKGYVPSSRGGLATHGWVEIYYNGGWYVCDVSFQRSYHRSGYMINYGDAGTWRYSDYHVADQNF